MLTSSTSIALGFAFVLLGGINVWLVLEAWGRVKASDASSRMIALHRIGGYLFIALFCVMAYFMVARLRAGGGDTSPAATIHLALAMILSPLLFIKVLIARYYKNQHSLLMPIGLTIFVLAFVLIASTAGPYFARASKIERVSIDPVQPPVSIDVNQAGDLMQKRCSKCHNPDRVVGARKDARGWTRTVNRMQAMLNSGISAADVRTIVSYLASQNQPAGSAAEATLEVGRALVDQRCGRCHSLDRVYKTAQTPEEWRSIVTRMVSYAAGSGGALQPGEDQQIIAYLSATQTPAAVTQRKALVDAASSGGRSLVGQSTPAAAAPVVGRRYDFRATAFISFVSLAVLALIMRRPGARAQAAAATQSKAVARVPVTAVPSPASSPLLLQLVQITKQTPDSKTLRFVVHGERTLNALPGQFLTFSFLFDGKKETRCYSICSSPARSGYVEITPKRVPSGCVSAFLNDRASIGLTVEATGPFGQFCLDPSTSRKIVLIAAGSGITPMMAMLRYLDDLCLDTQVTLLYCVRTSRDIMFRQELDELQTRLKSFRYHVMLSDPDPEWQGARGHIQREFIASTVPELNDQEFFLCGPPPFMDVCRSDLIELGAVSERIRQETFGGQAPRLKVPESIGTESTFTVEFARSRMTTSISGGQTLLQAAAGNGVEIPSACRQGQCGTCKTRLLQGDVSMTAEQGLDPDSKSRGYVLTCVGYARGNLILDA